MGVGSLELSLVGQALLGRVCLSQHLEGPKGAEDSEGWSLRLFRQFKWK